MNYQECIKLLTSQEKFQINLGLDRMKMLASLFNNPQNDLKIIHVAGTNGKGSVCSMLAKIFEENGYKTGLYTSPHIKDYTERIKINFIDISKQDFSKYIQLIDITAKTNNISITEFEMLTMMAFLYFKENNTNIVLLETGMGGRLDATNIIQKPVLSIITSISYDHLDRLGKTIEEISSEKAGIIKPEAPVIISKNNNGYTVIRDKAISNNSKILTVENNFELIDIKNNIFSNGEKSLQLSLRGINQGENIALVNKACEFLNLNIKNRIINVNWNSRFQYIDRKNLLVDAAHNPNAIDILKKNLNVYYNNQKRTYLFGVLNTKDYKEIIKKLFSNDDTIFVTDNFTHNAISKDILAKEITKNFPQAKIEKLNINDIHKFIDLKTDGIKICCGSFYICSKVL